MITLRIKVTGISFLQSAFLINLIKTWCGLYGGNLQYEERLGDQPNETERGEYDPQTLQGNSPDHADSSGHPGPAV